MTSLGNKEIFSENLKYYMKINNKTRKEICDALGFAYTTFADWYNGRMYPRIDKVEMLADYFGILKSDLIEDKRHEDIQSEENTYKHIGIVLNVLRTQNNKTIEEIAEEMHISADLIRDYEKATKKIPLNILIEFAKHYKVSIDELFGLKFNDANNTVFITTDKKMADQYRKWNEQIGYENKLTDDEIDKIISYTKFLISERKE